MVDFLTKRVNTYSDKLNPVDNDKLFMSSDSQNGDNQKQVPISVLKAIMGGGGLDYVDGYTSIFGERTDYQNYTFSMNMNDLSVISFFVNGFIKTDCLGAWIGLTTTENIQINDPDPCPTAGQIIIDGNDSSITIAFNSDGSVDVSGSVTDSYTSCEDVPTGSCSLI